MNIKVAIQLYEQSGEFENEDQFQVATATFLEKLETAGYLAFFFTGTNVYRRGLARNKISAMRLGAKAKRMGSKAGIPDILIYSHRIAIELKQKRGTVTAEQKAFMEKARFWGWICGVARSPAEVTEILREQHILGAR